MNDIDKQELLDKLNVITNNPSMSIVWHLSGFDEKPYGVTITYKISWRSRLKLYFFIDGRYILKTVTVQGFFKGYTIPVEDVDSGLLVSRLVKEVSIDQDRINKENATQKVNRTKSVKSLLGLRK